VSKVYTYHGISFTKKLDADEQRSLAMLLRTKSWGAKLAPVSSISEAVVPVEAPKGNDFYQRVIKARIGCAYGVKSCGSFAPNGVGSRQHTTCPKGQAALSAARG
jgi:hypothetical protein